MNKKLYIVDTLTAVGFWVPMGTLLNYVFLHLDWVQLIGVAVTGAVMNATLGGFYGRLLNLIRRKSGIR